MAEKRKTLLFMPIDLLQDLPENVRRVLSDFISPCSWPAAANGKRGYAGGPARQHHERIRLAGRRGSAIRMTAAA